MGLEREIDAQDVTILLGMQSPMRDYGALDK